MVGAEMSVRSERSSVLVRALLAVGVAALVTAGCASNGVVAGQSLPSGVTGSASGSLPASVASALTSATGSASDSSSDSSLDQDQSSSSSAPPESTAPAPDSSTSSSPAGQVYKVTDVVTAGGFKIKINAVTLPYNPPAGSEFTPNETRAWLKLDFQVTNVSGKQLMFSTLGAFDLRDGKNASYVTSVVAGDSLPKGQQFQDQEMQPNATTSGSVVFDVPQSGTGYRLIYRGNMWLDPGDGAPSIMLGR